MSISVPKAVFFDWDGTLVDSFAFLHKAHNHVREIFGMGAFTLEVFEEYFGMPREKLYADIYGPERIEEAKGHFEAFVIANQHEIKVIDGAADVLAYFAEAGVPMGIVTNKKGALVRQEIENHGWKEYFVSVVGAGEAAEDKPSSAPLILALEKSGLGVAAEDIWFVGDTVSDLACAKGVGAPCVLIEENGEDSEMAAEYSPFLIFKDCRGFSDFLLQSDLKSLQKNVSV